MEICSLHSNTLAPQPQGQDLTPVSPITIYTISSCYSHKWRSLVISLMLLHGIRDGLNGQDQLTLRWPEALRFLKLLYTSMQSRKLQVSMASHLEIHQRWSREGHTSQAKSLNGISPWNPSKKVTRRPYKPIPLSSSRVKGVQNCDMIYCHKRGSSAGFNDLPYSPQKRPWEGYCWPEPDWRHPPGSPWNVGTTCAEWDSFGSETHTRASPAVHAEVLCGHVWKNKKK